jgi:hypothetical protein
LLTYSDKAWNGKIAPQVDFKNEHLLFFSWGGSSGDKLTFKTVLKDGSPVVVFRYVQGEDTDLVPHVRVFVLPNDATWRLAVGDRPAGGPDKPAVREIQTNFIPPASTRGPQDAVRITSADELAKVFTDKPRYNTVVHQVDFDEEHLLFFNWSGGGGEKLDFRAIETAKGTEVVFRHDATSKDTAKRHIRLIVVPFHATWRVEAVKFEGPQKLEVRPIPLGPITVDRIAPAGGAGARIKNRDEAAVYFTDKTNLDVVLKRVDFSKEYLVLFAWQAATDDRLVTTMEVANGQKIAVFQYKPGVEKARRMRVELFGVPHEFTARGETLRVPIAEPINTRTREIDILGFQGPRPNDRAGKPIKIDSPAAAAAVFTEKAWLDKVLAQVDFTGEYLVYHAWTGARFDQLSFSLEAGEKGPIVAFHYAMGKNLAIGNYFRLFAVPNNATWRFEEVRGGKGK